MQLLKKFLIKKTICKGITSISFLQKGIAIAVSNYKENNSLTLIHCAFIEVDNTDNQQNMLHELARSYHLAEYDCHLILTTDHYRRVNVEAPNVPDNEMIEALRWKITDLIDFPVNKAVIDYYQAPMAVRANSSKMLEVIASPIDILKLDVQVFRFFAARFLEKSSSSSVL